MIKSILLENKSNLKYKDYEFRGSKATVLGIGNKSIKYSTDKDDEPQFAFYDSFEGHILSKAMIKSFDNPAWNEQVRSAIKAQEQYCKDNHDPLFAPQDGFCHSCGQQIYADIQTNWGTDWGYADRASNELITGCPHCHRSYID